jgi:hypothetical protein
MKIELQTDRSKDTFNIIGMKRDDLHNVIYALETQVAQKNIWNRTAYAKLLAQFSDANQD